MSLELRKRLFDELDSLVLIDPHTHINALAPASTTLADILGYHYYTELAHSAGMPKAEIEEPGISPKEKVRRLIANLGPIDNTIQHSWFIEMAQRLLGFQDDAVTLDNWEVLYDSAEKKMSQPDWTEKVLQKSRLQSVFLTNDFDDPLEGFDTSVYIPCLRTDDLVFHLAKAETQERLERASGTSLRDAASIYDAIANLFTHFKANGARACAISLPPDFSPAKISPGRAATAVDAVLARGLGASEADRRAAGQFVFWTIAEFANAYRLPFDLMIGVNRGVYADGVHQGRDLYDSRVSLIQYKELFNEFPKLTFPISVLASVTNQELTSYSWIFPNVVTNGHWWYSNTPTFIEHDLACRLEAVPRTKQIGYYSDMYKLEFALPKFAMYKRILAKVLAQRFVEDRGWSESRAIEFGKQVLRGNVEEIFGFNRPAGMQEEFIPPPRSVVSKPMATLAAAAAGLGGVAAGAAALGVAGIAAAAASADDWGLAPDTALPPGGTLEPGEQLEDLSGFAAEMPDAPPMSADDLLPMETDLGLAEPELSAEEMLAGTDEDDIDIDFENEDDKIDLDAMNLENASDLPAAILPDSADVVPTAESLVDSGFADLSADPEMIAEGQTVVEEAAEVESLDDLGLDDIQLDDNEKLDELDFAAFDDQPAAEPPAAEPPTTESSGPS